MTLKQQKEFINYIAPIIKRIGNERGYKIVSVFIAMACKEGGFGESLLAKKYHNHFGMKAGSFWKGGTVNLKTKEEYKVGILTPIVDGFRTYPDDISGINGFFDFISTNRYSNVKKQTSPLAVVTELKNKGYCTSSTYVTSVMNDYIKKFNLTIYDEVSISSEKPKVEYPTLSLGMSDEDLGGAYIESWQNYLYTLGLITSVSKKGTFDNSTYIAVKEYQKRKGLKSDGIIGINTWKSSPAYKEDK